MSKQKNRKQQTTTKSTYIWWSPNVAEIKKSLLVKQRREVTVRSRQIECEQAIRMRAHQLLLRKTVTFVSFAHEIDEFPV